MCKILKLVCVLCFAIFPCILGYSYLTPEHEVRNYYPDSFCKKHYNFTRFKLDNFNDSDTRTFTTPYVVNKDYFKNNGPLLLLLSDSCPLYIPLGILERLAKITDAAVLCLPTRYSYGYLPDRDLKYSATRQTLADIENFIKSMKNIEEFKKSKVVTFGIEYYGNLAVWMRALHPELVDAALGSSAPLLAKAALNETFITSTKLYRKYGSEKCVDLMRKRFTYYTTMFEMMKNNETILERVMDVGSICGMTDITKKNNQLSFLMDMAYGFIFKAQYYGADTIKYYCDEITPDEMTDNIGEKTDNVGGAGRWCNFGYQDKTIHDFKYINYDIGQSRMYLKCSEFGHYITSRKSDNNMFPVDVPLEYYVDFCERAFGPEFNRAGIERGVKTTNERYGGLALNATKVVIYSGGIDPSSEVQMKASISDDVVVLYYPDGTYAADWVFDDNIVDLEIKHLLKWIK